MRNPNFDILVVSVLEIDTENSTNANPPRGKFKVEEVLRGRTAAEIMPFVLMPPITADDYDENKKMKDSWYQHPLKGPTVGDKLIVFSYVTREATEIILQGLMFRYSDQNRLLVIEQMAPPEREAWIQLSIAALIIIIPFLRIFFFLRSRENSLSNKKRNTLRKFALALPLLSLGLYVYYESGISVYSNIRIDLLLIWPVMAFNIVLFFIFLLRKAPS